MDGVMQVLTAVLGDVWGSLLHNWPFLLASVVVASALKVYLGTERLAGWLRRRTGVAVVAAVALAALTPLCSCGTMAVVLGALASSVPWAPVVAFMVASPLTSPGEYVMSTGLFGPAFGTTYFVGAIVIGLAAGAATHLIEKTGWLVGQARMAADETCADARCSAAGAGEVAAAGGTALEPGGRTALAVLEAPVCCPTTPRRESRLPAFRQALLENARRLMVYFLGFATLGFLLIELVPTELLTAYLGDGSVLAVPLAAALGVPVYFSSEASLPMVAALMAGGMGAGPALAFLVTGAGTSIGALSGMLVIARWRVVALVVGALWVGAVVLGWVAPLWL